MYALFASLLLASCWGENAYIVKGTVMEVPSQYEVVLDHEEIPGLMGPMVMPFTTDNPDLLEDVAPGDRVFGRLMLTETGTRLVKIRVVGKGLVKADYKPMGPSPVQVGQLFPATEIPLSTGETVIVGEGQDRPTVLTFLYTSCPLPEYCPLLASRLSALQGRMGDEIRIVSVTIDPATDTPEVLTAYGRAVGAEPGKWVFGRMEPDAMMHVAWLSALQVFPESDQIMHGIRLMVLDRDGRLVERYDDNEWPLDEMVSRLRLGVD